MLRIQGLVLAALLAISPLALGQAGVQRIEFSQPGKKRADGLTPERLADHLKKKGHSAELTKNKKGAIVLAAMLKKGDCKYWVDIEYSADKKTCNLVCSLGNPARFSRERLLILLKAGGELRCGRFTFRESDNVLCFEDSNCSTTVSDEDFQQILDQFLEALRQTQPLWSIPDDGDAANQPPNADDK